MWMERDSQLLATFLVDLEVVIMTVQYNISMATRKGNNIPRDMGTKRGYTAHKETVPRSNTCLPDTCIKA